VGLSRPKLFRKAKAAAAAGDISSLELAFIHGYRGFDSRNNVHYLSNGSIVYHAAAAGIVYDSVSGKQSFYLEHTDDIISCTVNRHPKHRDVVATGQIGRRPVIYVWDAQDKEVGALEWGGVLSVEEEHSLLGHLPLLRPLCGGGGRCCIWDGPYPFWEGRTEG